MATDYFLKIDGIPGESQDSKHKGEIQLESFSWGDTQTRIVEHGGGGGPAPKTQFEDVHVVMKTNRASPQLMLASASGQHLKSAVLTARRAGKEQQEFLKLKLTDLLVSSYQSAGTAQDNAPVDQVSFNFGQIEVEYRPTKPDGTLDAPVKTGWDLKANKSV